MFRQVNVSTKNVELEGGGAIQMFDPITKKIKPLKT